VIAIIGVEGESAKREQSDSTPRPEPTSTPESGQPVVEVRCSDDSAATGGVSDILQTAPVTPTESAQPGRVERLPKTRQTIARRMLESLHTTAQLTTVIEADVTGIARLRAAEKNDFKHRTGTKLSYLPFFVKATVEALNEHPLAELDDQRRCHRDRVSRRGTPGDCRRQSQRPYRACLRNAQHMTIARMATAIAQVATAVRCGPHHRRCPDRRNLHHHQYRQPRCVVRHPDPQPTPKRDPGNRCGRRTCCSTSR